MSRLHFTTREIGSVKVFDLQGEETNQDTVQEVAWKIQRNIRRHRLQRVILNVQKIKFLDELAIRKLVAAFLRPQRSAIYGATGPLKNQLEGAYLPQNVTICPTEKEVAENFGPFLFHKEEVGRILGEADHPEGAPGVGRDFERRRSKRMHVAIPLEMSVSPKGKEAINTRGIATNISEGGVFIEYLDLDAVAAVEALEPIEGVETQIRIHPSGNFPEEYELSGVVRRREIRKRGLGLAIQFTPGVEFHA
jgi:hypothetical protein